MSKSKIKTKVSITMENYDQHTIEILDSIFESRVDNSCDVSLSSAEGQLFFCHRLVLCFNSNFLRKILEDVPVLAQPVICIPDVDGELLELVLRFIYTGEWSGVETFTFSFCCYFSRDSSAIATSRMQLF